MNGQERNLDTTRAVFDAFGAQETTRALQGLDPAVVIEFYGPADIPYAGTWTGHEGARRFFETVHASVHIHEFAPQQMLAQEDTVVVVGHLALEPRTTHQRFASDFVHVITFRDGRWLRFRDFMNTAVAVDAFRAPAPT